MMDSKKAIAVLAFSLGAGAVALPQIKPVLAPAILAAPSLPIATPPVPIAFGTTTQASGPGATVSAGGGVGINSPVGGLLGSVSKPSGLPTVNSLPLSLPAVDALPIPALPVPALPVPNLPIPNLPVPNLPIPNLPIPNLPVPNLPIPNLPVPNLPIPGVPAIPNDILSELSSGDQSAAIKKICELGTTVLSVILGVLSNGLGISLPKLPIDIPLPLTKRQLGGVGSILPIPTPITGSSGGLLGSLPIVGGGGECTQIHHVPSSLELVQIQIQPAHNSSWTLSALQAGSIGTWAVDLGICSLSTWPEDILLLYFNLNIDD
ncbi:hypothetical protein B0J11DRAFT_130791 [Dendryphion nanum]|uniref:Uncharacterized protein n=1 Tax=Dendryphion nanum TaxID=256645 RepID=A0A9P9D7W9_9PLEO|nr:hypothetical protein B0J11DRAFT_130791 [Dendryphion nanum]